MTRAPIDVDEHEAAEGTDGLDDVPEYECARPGPPDGCGECDACAAAYDDR